MRNFFRLFYNLRIGLKLFICYSFIFILALTIGGFIVYSLVRGTIESNIESELNNVTATILEMVKTSVDLSIKNHLRAVSEKNKDIVKYFYMLSEQSIITEEEAKERAAEILLSQRIGETGYIFVWDIKKAPESIPLAVHPIIQGKDVAYVDFVQIAVRMKEGYIEYEWKNPNDEEDREKAMYFSYFEPWEWVIAASSYREEFLDLIDVLDFKDQVLSIKFGETGYSYIIDSKGNVILHPFLVGNVYDVSDTDGRMFVHEICRERIGKIIYSWKNQDETEFRKKLVIFNYIPEFDWIVASSSYLDEFYAPLKKIKFVLITTVVVLLLFVLISTLLISSHITKPLLMLVNHFKKGDSEDFSIRIPSKSKDEVGQVAMYFNSYMKKLEEYSNSLKEEINIRVEAQKALKDSEEKYKSIYYDSREAFMLLKPYGNYISGNPAAIELFKCRSERDLINLNPLDLSPTTQEGGVLSSNKLKEVIDHTLKKGSNFFEWKHKQINGEEFFSTVLLTKIQLSNDIIIQATVRDITKQKHIEEQLHQVQKMEIVGTLAGGLAHDFNNVLGGIIGTLSIMKYKLKMFGEIEEKSLLDFINIMEESGNKAANLIKQLLTMSRKHKMEFKQVNLNQIIKNVMAIGENSFHKLVKLDPHYYHTNAMIKGDPNQIEQVLLNFCVNAVHSMTIMRGKETECGGVLIVSIDCLKADRYFKRSHPGADKEKYWILSVKDTGVGMDKDTILKIFNPFFTTKEKGTGLGLSMVYNVIKLHNGFIKVYSEIGMGSTFNVFIPVLEEKEISKEKIEEKRVPKGHGFILVIDDEKNILRTAKEMLKDCGYTVILAENGKIGVELFEKYYKKIKAVLLDMSMPEMSGKDVYICLKKIDPNVKVILSTGFRQDERVQKVLDLGVNAFLQKPYTFEQLAKAIGQL